jgi:two-component sensor histidine kinase
MRVRQELFQVWLFLAFFLVALYLRAQNSEQQTWVLYKQSLSKSIPFQSTIKACEEALEISKAIRHDKLQLKAQTQLGILFWNDGQFDKALMHLRSAQSKSQATQDSVTLAQSIHYQGLTYYYKCSFDSALQLYDLAEQLYHSQKLDSAVAKIKNHKGLIYHAKGQYSEAIQNMMESFYLQEKTPGYRDMSVPLRFSTEAEEHQYFESKLQKDLESLDYLKDTKDLDKLVLTLTNIGKDYYYQKKFREAVLYLKRSTSIQKQLGQLPFTGDLAAAYVGLGQYDSAEYWYKSRLAEVKKSGTQIHLAAVYLDIGLMHRKQKNWNEALHYLTLARELNSKLGLLRSLSTCNRLRAQTFTELNRFGEAQSDIDASIRIATQIGCIRDLQESLEVKSTILQSLNRHQEAFDALRQSELIGDSLVNGESRLRIARLQIEYDTDKKTRDLASLQVKNSLHEAEIENKNLFLLIGFILVVAVMALIAFVYYRLRQKVKESHLLKLNAQLANEQAEQRTVMLAEIHHRVKNNLQIISSLINLKSNQASAEVSAELQQLNGRVFSMGLIHDKLYKTENIQLVRLDSYLGELCQYLIDTFASHENPVVLKFQAESIELDADKTLSCGLICNEVITNSLKHAFSLEQQDRVIVVTLNSKAEQIKLLIQDNGRNSTGVTQTGSRSFGLRFVDQLVRSKLSGYWTMASDNGMNTSITFPRA